MLLQSTVEDLQCTLRNYSTKIKDPGLRFPVMEPALYVPDDLILS